MTTDPGDVPTYVLADLLGHPQFGAIAASGLNHDGWAAYVASPAFTPADRETLMHVLAHYRVDGAYPGGTFTRTLLQAVARADNANRNRLALAYPLLVGLAAAFEYREDLHPHLLAAAGLPRPASPKEPPS